MAPPDGYLNDPKYSNWVKCGLALNITNEVLGPFVVKEITKLHQSIIKKLPPGVSCGGCRVNTVCPNGICNIIQYEIKSQHWYGNPSFTNTCTGRWSREPWEIAKCYMSPSKGCKSSSAADADFSASINVIINCKHFQAFGTNDPRAMHVTNLSKSKDFRNSVMHARFQRASDNYMKEHLDVLINVLNMVKTPETEADTEEAIHKIEQIKTNQRVLKLEDVIEVRKNATEAIADRTEKDSEQVQRERLLVNFETGCRKALCRLTEEYISKQEENVSVADFLSSIRFFAVVKNLCQRHQEMLFPKYGSHADIREWDLFVYCFILEELDLHEAIGNAVFLFVQEVKKIRDKLLLDATGIPQDDLSELCEYLIDTDLNTEITEIFNKASPDVDVIRSNNTLVSWWREEEDYGNKQVSKKQLNNIKQTMKEFDERIQKNIKRFAEVEDNVQRLLEKLGYGEEDMTLQRAYGSEIGAECNLEVNGCDRVTKEALQEDITSPNNNDIKEPLNHVCHKLNLLEVKPVKGSIVLNVTCSSITNVIDFWDSCIDGRAVEALSGLRDYYRQYFKCDTLEFDVILSKNGVSRCVNNIGEGLSSHYEGLVDKVTQKVNKILKAKDADLITGSVENLRFGDEGGDDQASLAETPFLDLPWLIDDKIKEKEIKQEEHIGGHLVANDRNAILKSLAHKEMGNDKTENFYRLIRLVVDVGTEVLLQIFKNEINVSNKVSIKEYLKSKESKLKELMKGKILNDKQIETLTQINFDETKLDISLLFTLLRNLTDIQEPNTGWDACPLPSDMSQGALLTRLKGVRNDVIAHPPKASLKKSEFEKSWEEASLCLLELAGGISSDERLEVQKKVDHCKTQPLFGHEESKVDARRKWEIDERYSEPESKVDTSTDKVDKQDSKCQNYEKGISELREDIEGLKGVELKREMGGYGAKIIKIPTMSENRRFQTKRKKEGINQKKRSKYMHSLDRSRRILSRRRKAKEKKMQDKQLIPGSDTDSTSHEGESGFMSNKQLIPGSDTDSTAVEGGSVDPLRTWLMISRGLAGIHQKKQIKGYSYLGPTMVMGEPHTSSKDPINNPNALTDNEIKQYCERIGRDIGMNPSEKDLISKSQQRVPTTSKTEFDKQKAETPSDGTWV